MLQVFFFAWGFKLPSPCTWRERVFLNVNDLRKQNLWEETWPVVTFSLLQWWKCLYNVYTEVLLLWSSSILGFASCLKSCLGEQDIFRIIWRV